MKKQIYILFIALFSFLASNAQPSIEYFSIYPGYGCPPPITIGLNAQVGGNYNNGDTLVYNWVFGDGSGDTTIKEAFMWDSSWAYVTHTYNSVGVFTAELIVTGPDSKSDTETIQIPIYNTPCPPVITYFYSYPYNAVCINQNISFTAPGECKSYNTGDTIDCTWIFGDGNTLNQKFLVSSNKTFNCTTSHIYSVSGTFVPQVIVKGPDGVSDTAILTNPIIIGSNCPPSISSLYLNKYQGCKPQQITFYGFAYGHGYSLGDTLTYNWYVGDGSVLTTKAKIYLSGGQNYTNSSINYTYNNSGKYSVQLIVSGPDGLTDTSIYYNILTVLDSCPPPPPPPAQCCIKGRVYQDLNGNCTFDNEPIQQKWMVQLFKGSIFYQMDKPDVSGWYYFYFPCDSTPKNYVVRIDPFFYWWQWDATCPASQTYFINPQQADTCITLDFGVDTISTTIGQDLAVATDVVGGAYPGNSQNYITGVCNKGNVSMSGTLMLVHDSYLSYTSASPVPDAVSGDTLKWNFSNLAPGACISTTSTLKLSTSTFNGMPIWYKGIVEPIAGDLTPYNNMDTGIVMVGAPYDPNNKLSSPGGVSGKILPSTQELNYTINFQNTGTAPAYNIVLLDTLPVNEIDLGSIRFGASSFPYTLDFFGNGIVKITFTNIMLPDSNADEAGSHGFVQYTAKLKSNLPIGTQIKNRAGIYFDFNEVVMTEYAVNIIDTNLTGIKDVRMSEYADVRIYPNPSKNEVVILYSSQLLTPNSKLSIGVFNLLGELVLEKHIIANRASAMDVSNLSGGIYFVKSTTDKNSPVKKLVIVK